MGERSTLLGRLGTGGTAAMVGPQTQEIIRLFFLPSVLHGVGMATISNYRICRDFSCAAWICPAINTSIKIAMHGSPGTLAGTNEVGSVLFRGMRQRFRRWALL